MLGADAERSVRSVLTVKYCTEGKEKVTKCSLGKKRLLNAVEGRDDDNGRWKTPMKFSF
jgi:hypothetical protein